MDPNAALDWIADLADGDDGVLAAEFRGLDYSARNVRLNRGRLGQVADRARIEDSDLAEAVLSLAEWIDRGGFLPDAWQP